MAYNKGITVLNLPVGDTNLGLIAESIVSLTSSLRGQLVKCFTTL